MDSPDVLQNAKDLMQDFLVENRDEDNGVGDTASEAVSYTHLTLPTKA